MTRSQKFLSNTIASALYQITVMLIGILTPRIMLLIYGSELNGLVASITQFVTYFNVVQAGLSSAAIYALYRPLSEQNQFEISGIVVATRNFFYRSGMIFIIILLFFSLVYPIFVSTNAINSSDITILILVIGTAGIVDFFLLAKYSALLAADQRSYVISFASLISVVINFVIVVVLAYRGVDIVMLKSISIITVFARSLYIRSYCIKRYSYLNYHIKPNNSALSRRWSALVLQVLQLVQNGAPIIILTTVSTLKRVSIYSIYSMIILGISSLLDIFMSGLSASFGEIISQNKIEVLQRTYRDFEFLYYGLISIVYSVSLVMIMPFIRIYTNGVSDTNYNLPIIGFLFVLNAYLYNIKTPQGMLVISAGLFKETQTKSLLQAIIIVVPGFILAYLFDISGVLLALILSNFYRDIDLIFFVPAKITNLPVKETLLRIVRSIISIALSSLPMQFIANLNIDSILQWIIVATLVTVYSSIMWLSISIIFDRKQLVLVKQRIYFMVKNTRG